MSKRNQKKANRRSRKWNQVYKRDILPNLPTVEELQNCSFIQKLASTMGMPVEQFINKETLKNSPATRRMAKTTYKLFHRIDILNSVLGGFGAWYY